MHDACAEHSFSLTTEFSMVAIKTPDLKTSSFITCLMRKGVGGWGLRDEKERVRNLTPSSHEGVVFMGEESRKMCRYISTSRHKTSQAHRRYQLARSRGSGLAGTAMRCLALLVHHYDSVSRNAVITFFFQRFKGVVYCSCALQWRLVRQYNDEARNYDEVRVD